MNVSRLHVYIVYERERVRESETEKYANTM